MPRILSSERVIEYSVEFKIKIIKLTFELDVKAIDIAKVLNLESLPNKVDAYLNQKVGKTCQ
jgi:transposase